MAVHVVRLLCCLNGEYDREWSGSLVPRLSNCPVLIIKKGKYLYPVNEVDRGREKSLIKRMNFVVNKKFLSNKFSTS